MEREQVLREAAEKIECVCEKIIRKEAYKAVMPECIQAVQNACILVLEEHPKDTEVLHLLEDIMYGMTQQDEVFLLDVLRFGMCEKLKQYEKSE